MEINLIFLITLFISLCLSFFVLGDNPHSVLTEVEDAEAFESSLDSLENTLLYFYADWCGNCKNFKPVVEEAAEELRKKNIPSFQINCKEHEELCNKFLIRVYPTLKLKSNDTIFDCESGTAIGIAQQVLRLTRPPVLTIETIEELNDVQSHSVYAVLGFFENDESEEFHIFDNLAKSHREIADFVITESKDISLELNASFPSLFVLKKEAQTVRIQYSGPFEASEMEKFIMLERVPILGEIDMTNVDIYLGPKMPIAFVFFSKDEDKERFEKELFPLAEKYRTRFIIALINGLEHGSHATTLGLQENRFPAVVIHELVSGYKYPFSQDEPVSSSTLGPYFESFASGSLQPYFISAPIPEKNDEPVRILVHDNFKSIALDPTKDVLVELYTAWCGQCKVFAPAYEQLGLSFLPHKDTTVIAKMDIQKNDQPKDVTFEFSDLPAFILFPAIPNAQPIVYKGRMSLDDLKAFLAKESVHKAVPINIDLDDEEESDEEYIKEPHFNVFGMDDEDEDESHFDL